MRTEGTNGILINSSMTSISQNYRTQPCKRYKASGRTDSKPDELLIYYHDGKWFQNKECYLISIRGKNLVLMHFFEEAKFPISYQHLQYKNATHTVM